MSRQRISVPVKLLLSLVEAVLAREVRADGFSLPDDPEVSKCSHANRRVTRAREARFGEAPAMQFHVGPWVYTVQITDAPILADDGAEQAGRWVWSTRTILISGTIPVQRRLQVLLHELVHAWRHDLGKPATDEDDANSMSAFTASVMRQLYRQGGEPALMRLSPDGIASTDVGDWDSASEITGAQCGTCGTSFSPMQIVTSAPVGDATTGRMFVIRALLCEHCGHVQQWREGATNAGAPNGRVLGTPRLLRGEAMTAFLREHGQQFGVMVH
jgi:hypothetical protein